MDLVERVSLAMADEIFAMACEGDARVDIMTGDDVRRLAKAALNVIGQNAVSDMSKPSFRHVKRGSVYRVIGDANLQVSTELTDGAIMVVYVGEDGTLWTRQKSEFMDGRFEPVNEDAA